RLLEVRWRYRVLGVSSRMIARGLLGGAALQRDGQTHRPRRWIPGAEVIGNDHPDASQQLCDRRFANAGSPESLLVDLCEAEVPFKQRGRSAVCQAELRLIRR